MKKLLFITISFTFLLSCNWQKENEPYHFYVATDIHMTKQRPDYTSLCFKENILPDIKKDSTGLGKFIVVTGDMDPFFRTRESVEEVLGKDFRFYPVPGNHDVGMTNNQFKDYPDANWNNTFEMIKYNKDHLKKIANWGPVYRTPALDSLVFTDSLGHKHISTYDSADITGSKYTTYSFDEGNSHFIVLDLYSGLQNFEARHNARIFNEMYDWLTDDLEKNKKENVFVFSHQPVKNDTGETPHVLVNEAYKKSCLDLARTYGADSLSVFKSEFTDKIRTRDEFWNLLKKHKVIAYFCGHTHHYSAKKYDGVWEINLEFGAWNIEGRTRYGEVFIKDGKVDLLVKGYMEKTNNFKIIDRINLKN